MAHRVQSVSMIDQNILQAIFIGGEVIQYDLRKMLSILPQFQEIPVPHLPHCNPKFMQIPAAMVCPGVMIWT